MEKIKGLDTLRAFAVLFVFIAHLGVRYDGPSFLGRFLSFVLLPTGRFGVDLFFVLSGFLISSILFRAKESAGGRQRFLIIRNFFVRRALRIFPIYYLLLFILYFVDYPDVRNYFWYYATYTANLIPYYSNSWNKYCHTWTLAVEEQFYLLWPWLVVLVSDKWMKLVFFFAVAAGVVSTFITMDLQNHMEPFLVVNYFDAFALGGIYAWVRHDVARVRKFERVIRVLACLSLAILFYWKSTILLNLKFGAVFLVTICNSIVAMWLILLVINNKSQRLRKYLLENRILNYVGTISYCIYLCHLPYLVTLYGRVEEEMEAFCSPFPLPNKLLFVYHGDYIIHFCIIIGIAGFSYRFIERPILNLKSRFEYLGEKQTS